MSKLIYIHNDDERLSAILLRALQEAGYAPDFTSSKNLPAGDRLRADIAIVCQPNPTVERITVGDITLDLDSVCAYDRNNRPIHFTPIEFAMLSYLMKNAHRAVARAELLRAVWGFEDQNGSRVADDAAKRLRRKLKDSSLVLETVWNFGFRVRAK